MSLPYVINAVQKYRVFVFGLEVTDDLLSVSFSCHDGRAPSTANFTLNNEWDKYTVSVTDMAAIFEGVDTDLLRPQPPVLFPTGEQLLASDKVYTVQPGDTTGEIASRFGLEVKELLAYNPYISERPDRIRVGERFIIPERVKFDGEALRQAYREEQRGRLDKLIGQLKTQIQDLPEPKRTIIQQKVGVYVDVEASQVRVREDGTVVSDDRVVTNTRALNADDFQLAQAADVVNAFNAAGLAPTYPLVAGNPVFHTSDPVRVFMNDPVRPNDWYFAFSGKLSSWSQSVDINEQNQLSCTVEDIRRDMKYARITTNPGVIDQTAGTVEKDIVFRDFKKIPLSGAPLEQKIYNLMFGFDLTEADQGAGDPESAFETTVRRSVNGVQVTRVRSDAIGAMTYEKSATFLLGEAGREDPIPDAAESRRVNLDTAANGRIALQSYLAYTDTRVKASDLDDLDTATSQIAKNALQKVNRTRIDDIVTFIGEHPERYPVDGGRLFILMPASLGTSETRIFKLGFQDVATKTDFVNRLGLILDVTDLLDFSFWVDGRGDVRLELPLRDFDPYDLGTEPIDGNEVVRAMAPSGNHSRAFIQTLESIDDSAFPAFADRHRVKKGEETEHTRSFVDERVRTLFRTSWSFTNLEAEGDAAEKLNAIIVKLPALIAAFGPRAEEASPEFYFGPQTDVAQAAAVFHGLTELNKLNAEANEVAFSMHPARPGMFPNRPVEVESHGYVGTIRNVEYTWKPGTSTSDMSLSLNSVRNWSGGFRIIPGAGRNIRYYPGIAGDVGQPLDYAERLGLTAEAERQKIERERQEAQEEQARRQARQRSRRSQTRSGGDNG